jgi:hypothetical protein
MSAIKQHSPAGSRRAGRKIHQIEKMRHGESSIVGVPAPLVKLAGEVFQQEPRRPEKRDLQGRYTMVYSKKNRG